MFEKRTLERFDLKLPIRINRPSSRIEYYSYTMNISSMGVFVLTGRFMETGSMEIGSIVSLEFMMPANIKVNRGNIMLARGKVIRVAGDGIAILFVNKVTVYPVAQQTDK